MTWAWFDGVRRIRIFRVASTSSQATVVIRGTRGSDYDADAVMQANGGNRTVPTLVFADGTALTNPSIDQVKAQLAALPGA